MHRHPHGWRGLPATAFLSVLLLLAVAVPAHAGAGHAFPVDGPHLYGSPYGEDRGDESHRGQDLPAAQGTPVRAVSDGRVAHRQYQAGGAGNYVVIYGADGRDSVYMHLVSPAFVAPGSAVRAGQMIGRVGSTGRSTGPHLHFELWTPHWYRGGHDFDPVRLLRRWDKPAPPRDLTARRGAERVSLDWSPLRERDVIGYRVYRRTPARPYKRIGSTRASDLRDPTARRGRSYAYRVKAVDGSGFVSAPSEPAEVSEAGAAEGG